MQILVAEDSHVSQLVVKTCVQKLGHEVILAADGAEAWDLFQGTPVRLIISDWMMPQMDGLELCRRIRAHQADSSAYTYFILLTAKADRPSLIEGLEAGADDFMTKPLDREELRVRLVGAERVLDLRDRLVQLEGILPVCSYCRQIRDDREMWQQFETYIEKHSAARFSHSICPACWEEHVATELKNSARGAV